MHRHELLPMWITEGCTCRSCHEINQRNKSMDQLLPLIDFSSTIWDVILGHNMVVIPVTRRLKLFDNILNGTATIDRWLPDFSFTPPAEQQMDSNSSSSTSSSSLPSTEGGYFAQLCMNLKGVHDQHLRGRVGDVLWRARFKGLLNKGAEGLPGPFRQSLTEICADLRRTSTTSLFIPSPNFVNETGLDRNKLILNPNPIIQPDQCYRLGQLIGIIIRSQGTLDIDIAEVFWKQLLDVPLTSDDLASFDYTAWQNLQFKDHR
jgi:hypothetical protein